MTAIASNMLGVGRLGRLPTRMLAGLLLLGVVAVFGFLGPLLIPHDPAHQELTNSLQAPGAQYWLGADVYGRDLFSRLAHATGLSLGLAALSVATAAIPGVLLGVLAVWRGGWVERALVLLSDAALSIPGLLIVVLFATIAPGARWALYVGIAFYFWTEYFRVARAASRPILAGPAVEASRLLGFGPAYILSRHLAPALAPVIGTLLAFSLAQAVLALAALGFISVGLRPPTPELGLMMTEALPFYHEAPWLLAAPVGVLVLMVLGMMLVAPDRDGT